MTDQKLSFTENVDVYKKAQQRLYLLGKLKRFNVSSHTVEYAYRGLTESVLTFSIVTWFGNLTVKINKKEQS